MHTHKRMHKRMHARTQPLLTFPTDAGDLNSGPHANEMQQIEPSPPPFLSHLVLF